MQKLEKSRVIFAEGEDKYVESMLWKKNRLGKPILIGAENRIKEHLKK